MATLTQQNYIERVEIKNKEYTKYWCNGCSKVIYVEDKTVV